MISLLPLSKTVLALVVSTCFLYAVNAAAHQQKVAITTLLFNERTGNLEVSHRFYVHDAEHAVKRIFKVDADLIADTSTQQQFGHYVEEHFGLRTLGLSTSDLNKTDSHTAGSYKENQQPLVLSYVGHELDGKFFWVYQEVTIPKAIGQLQLEVFHNSLQALWPTQVNLVNIEGRGTVKSLRFAAKDDWQKVVFD